MKLGLTPNYGTRRTTKRVNLTSGIPLPPVVTTAEFKTWAKITDDSEDALIDSLLASATQAAETYTRRSLHVSTWVTFQNDFCTVELNVIPVDETTIEISYYDVDNVEQTLDASFYEVIDNGPDAYTCIEFIGEMPVLYNRSDAVAIMYDGGYGTDIPEPIRIGIMKRAASDFENRQDAASAAPTLINNYSHSDWFPYKML